MKQNLRFIFMTLLCAVFSTAWGADTWVKTNPSDLQTGDIVVIVDQTSSMAMSNDKGTGSAPSATSVTLNTDKSEIISEVASTLQWEVTVDNGAYQFSVGESYLYCTNTNNGVRVGSNTNNSFTWVEADANNTNYYLFNTATSRYIGVYSDQDWRCYPTVNNNIKNTLTAFYKKVTSQGPVDPVVTISANEVEVGETISITVPSNLTDVSYKSDDESVATVDENGVVTGVAEGETDITVTWPAVEGLYNAGPKIFTITVTPASEKTVFVKVTNSNQLVAGNEYILVAPNNGMAMSEPSGDGKYRTNVAVTIANDKVTIKNTEKVAVLTLDGTIGAWTFLASDNNQYLALPNASNELRSSAEISDNSRWTVTSDFELANKAFNNRTIKYNSGSPRFACYTSGQQTAVLFVKEGSEISNLKDPELSFDNDSFNVLPNESNFTAPTLNNPHTLTVSYSSSDENLATVDTNTGEVVIGETEGTVTITASFAGNDEYAAGTASYTITIAKGNAELSFDTTSFEVEPEDDFTAPTLSNPHNLTVTYSSSDENLAVVDAATGEVLIGSDEGVVTITASFAGNAQYNSGSAYYTIKIGDPKMPGSLEKPYSVAEARAAIDANTGITGVYATGIVSEIVTAYNSQYGNISYNISADGTTSGDQLQAYRGKSYNGENFTSEDDIQVGDVVVVYGNLTKYNSIYEFAQGNQLVSLTRKNAIASDIDITPLSVNINKTGTFTATVTVAEGLSDSDYTLSWTSSDENSLIVENGSYIVGDKKGKVTITVTVNPSEALSSQYKPFSKPFVVTIIDPNANDGSWEKPFTVADVLEYDGTADNVWVKGYIVGSYNTSNVLTDVTGDDAPVANIALFDNKTGATTANTIPVQLTNTSNDKLLIRNTLNLNDNPGVLGEEVLVYGNITKYFGKQGLKETSDAYIILPEIGSAGYSTTYYSNADLKVQDGTEAYAVTGNTNQLTYTSVGNVIPAGVAVVLKGSGPQKFQIVSAPENTTDFFQYANNNLKGLDVDGPTVGPYDNENDTYVYYKLTVENGVVGFYWAEANGAAFNSKAHKAYLVLPASDQVVSSYAFDETVGISSPMLNEIKSEGVYTLSGVRVMSDHLPKGIYIVNGKKMVIK